MLITLFFIHINGKKFLSRLHTDWVIHWSFTWHLLPSDLLKHCGIA